MSERPSEDRIDRLIAELDRDAEASGYHLNPDHGFVRSLAVGLLTNEDRYGYRACPCRLAAGERESDLDIICPCYYRDPDLSEYGACYCALYVSEDVAKGSRELTPVPERRPPEEERETTPRRAAEKAGPGAETVRGFDHPVWRCKVCGYLCARETPPEVCPICKAKSDRFARFP